MIDELSRDYVRTAHSKGVGNRAVLWRHTFRNAFGPVLSQIGLDLGFFLGGVVVVERIFSWPGIGKLRGRLDRHRRRPAHPRDRAVRDAVRRARQPGRGHHPGHHRPADPGVTYSIVALDRATGDLGVAVQSKFLAVGRRRAVGAGGGRGGGDAGVRERRVRAGRSGARWPAARPPTRRCGAWSSPDSSRDQRQVGIVDARGGAASHTGPQCFAWAGGRTGDGFAAQGNILAGAGVVDGLADTFLAGGSRSPSCSSRAWRRPTRQVATGAVASRPRFWSCATAAATAAATTAGSTCGSTITTTRSASWRVWSISSGSISSGPTSADLAPIDEATAGEIRRHPRARSGRDRAAGSGPSTRRCPGCPRRAGVAAVRRRAAAAAVELGRDAGSARSTTGWRSRTSRSGRRRPAGSTGACSRSSARDDGTPQPRRRACLDERPHPGRSRAVARRSPSTPRSRRWPGSPTSWPRATGRSSSSSRPTAIGTTSATTPRSRHTPARRSPSIPSTASG